METACFLGSGPLGGVQGCSGAMASLPALLESAHHRAWSKVGALFFVFFFSELKILFNLLLSQETCKMLQPDQRRTQITYE